MSLMGVEFRIKMLDYVGMFGSKNRRVNLVIGTVGVFRVEPSLMMIRN